MIGAQTCRGAKLVAALAAFGALVVAGCTESTAVVPDGHAGFAVETAASQAQNAVGDHDSAQALVPFTPAARIFTVSVPEGWAQTGDSFATTFTDDSTAVRIEERPALVAPSPDSVRLHDLPEIQSTAANYRFAATTIVQRAAGPAVLITYQVASPPDRGTGMQAVERYVFWRDGCEVILTLSGPVGTDNSQLWRTITDSLQWL